VGGGQVDGSPCSLGPREGLVEFLVAPSFCRTLVRAFGLRRGICGARPVLARNDGELGSMRLGDLLLGVSSQ